MSLSLVGVACQPPGRFDVSTTTDGRPGSLRAAIAAANASRASAIRIELPAGTYELTQCGADDSNESGDLDLTTAKPVVIEASEPNVVVHQTCEGERVLDAHGSGLLTLIGITVTGGTASSADPAQPAQGGGVRAQGDLKLERVKIANNAARGAAGQAAAAGEVPVAGGSAYGGGVFVAGSLVATSSDFTLNLASGGSGPDAPADDGLASSGGAAEGGGAYVVGSITINAGTISENRAVGGNGGYSRITPGGGGSVRGGGIAQRLLSTQPVEVVGAVLAANHAQGGMSGVSAGFAFPAGPPAGDAIGGALASSGALSLQDVKASQNTAAGGSTGFSEERPCTNDYGCKTRASAGRGLGGALAAESTARIDDSELSGNATSSGDAFWTCFSFACQPIGTAASVARGGALWAGKDIELETTTFVDNRAKQGKGTQTTNVTGGGAVASDANLHVVGSHFTGNVVEQGQGGAISAAVVNLAQVTLSNNRASAQGGAVDAQSLTGQDVTASHNTSWFRGGALAVAADATLERSAIIDNSVTAGHNGGTRGGGLYVGGQLTLRQVNVSRNSGTGAAFTGGGVWAGSVTAESVSFVANKVQTSIYFSGQGPIPGTRSGGGAITAAGSVRLTNATLSDNAVSATATGPFEVVADGAAVLAPTLALDHCTLADNRGAPSLLVAELTTYRSVIASSDELPVCAPELTAGSGAYNHLSDTSCALPASDNEQGDAEFLLGPAVDNGGAPVLTRRPADASVLIDRVPASVCPIRVDARDVSRPRGGACDIGALEVDLQGGGGAADLTLAFTNPPAGVTPGAEGTWQLTVTNNGPQPKAPAVRIQSPAGVVPTSAAATGGAHCTTTAPILCVWHQLIAPGAAATITFSARVDPSLTASIVSNAEVIATDLRPPLEDDQAALSTPLTPATGIQMSSRFTRIYDDAGRPFPAIAVALRNSGPSTAVGTAAAPIEVIWDTAPGVRVVSAPPPIGLPEPIVGTFTPSAQPFTEILFAFEVDGPPPAELGTLTLRHGANVQAPSAPIPVFAADLELRAYRTGGAEQPGTATAVRFEITNHGAAAATDTLVAIDPAGAALGKFSPSIGTVAQVSGSASSIWTLPVLAAGQTATLTAEGTGSEASASVVARAVTSVVDLNANNDWVELDLRPAPEGTADLELSSFQMYAGSSSNRRVVRLAVTNRGPLPARAGEFLPLELTLSQFVDFSVVRLDKSSSDWTCDSTSPYYGPTCTSTASLAPGASASFEIEVEVGAFTRQTPNVRAHIEAPQTPDPDPNNNTRYLDLTAPL